MEERTKVVIYARVSTSTQDYTRQITELRNYAWKQNYQIVKEFSEKISGGKKIEERAAIRELLDFVKSNKVDKVVVYEASRLSRRQLDFLSIIETLTELGVSLYILQSGLETLLPDGTPSPVASLVLGIMSQFNSLEKSLIRARCASGYEHYRAKGGRVGRKEGYRKSDDEYRKKLRTRDKPACERHNTQRCSCYHGNIHQHVEETEREVLCMLNYRRIKLVYHHCGLATAIEVAIKFVAIDILAILAYIGYCLTLPYRFFWILFRGVK